VYSVLADRGLSEFEEKHDGMATIVACWTYDSEELEIRKYASHRVRHVVRRHPARSISAG